MPFLNAPTLLNVSFNLTGGEHGIGLPAVIEYPYFDHKNNKQKFPHRTLAMLISLITHVIVSCLANFLFKKGILPRRYDFLKFFDFDNANENSDVILTSVPVETQKIDGKSLMSDLSAEMEDAKKKTSDKSLYKEENQTVGSTKKSSKINSEKIQFSTNNDLVR